MGSDMRGDPAAALLEVLDPAQNDTFQDHYIDLPFDLSEVMFIATANYRWKHPRRAPRSPRNDRGAGLHALRKCAIARQFLIPKQIKEHGLTTSQIAFETRASSAWSTRTPTKRAFAIWSAR